MQIWAKFGTTFAVARVGTLSSSYTIHHHCLSRGAKLMTGLVEVLPNLDGVRSRVSPVVDRGWHLIHGAAHRVLVQVRGAVPCPLVHTH